MKKTIKTNEKLSINAAVVTKLEKNLTEEQLKKVQGGGAPSVGPSASGVC